VGHGSESRNFLSSGEKLRRLKKKKSAGQNFAIIILQNKG